MIPIILRIDPNISKSNSSFGNYSMTYFIKWSLTAKNEISMSKFFMTRQDAIKWSNDSWKIIKERNALLSFNDYNSLYNK